MTVDIEKLKALALAASPGPWQWWTSNSMLRLTGADGRDGGVLHGYVHAGVGDVPCSEPNRAFIEAANPAAVLELIAEVERLLADATRYRWLRNTKRSHAHVGRIVDNSGKAGSLAEFSLDRAIDAAIEKEKA